MMCHDLDKLPEPDALSQFAMDQGKIVGQLAKKLFVGVDVQEADFLKNVEQTKVLLKEKKTIFEAGILVGDLYARADVLVPVGDAWDVIEVKGSTRVKDEHVQDVSFQKYVYSLAGLNIRKCFLLYVNKEFVKHGEVVPEDFFVQKDITADVDAAMAGIEERVRDMLEIIKSEEAPDVSVGNGCNAGVGCASADCWSFLPEGNVFELYRGKEKSLELLEAEVVCLKDIPDDFKLTSNQHIQKECAKTGLTHVNKPNIARFLNTLAEPVHYLDFETFQTAIPLYDGLKPWQKIPFQFSLHADGKHYEFLHDNAEDPRKPFLEALKNTMDASGSIVVFNQSFEQARLNELAEAFPEYSHWVESVIKRMVDLIIPFKNFDYYNAKQKGSCSIKAVLPAVTGKGYADMNINEGGMAAAAYFEMIFGKGDKKQIRKDLLEYCKLDTEGMVWVVEALRKVCG